MAVAGHRIRDGKELGDRTDMHECLMTMVEPVVCGRTVKIGHFDSTLHRPTIATVLYGSS